MFKIKRLYLFMLRTFLPLFAMTFCICLFIVMMQFLWRYLDELVGKGLSLDVVAEMFFYAALSMVPTALPLSILLAALMTFGNLGEHVELTALKSSGISLTTIMKPLAVLVAAVSVGAFFFQNEVVPRSQVQMWTLLFSMRQKSPTLDIPEGAVYSQIPGFNLYVKHKDEVTGKLYDIIIYDVTNRSTYPRVVVADSGRLAMTEDKRHLVLTLDHGEWYEDLKGGNGPAASSSQQMYRREQFNNKEILIKYDDNFTRMDDNMLRQQYVGKNVTELQATIDSVTLKVDSTAQMLAHRLRTQPTVGMPFRKTKGSEGSKYIYEPIKEVHPAKSPDFKKLFASLTTGEQQSVVSRAIAMTTSQRQDAQFQSYTINDDNFIIRRHQIELMRKYTLSLACLIFFFIGAPLGAIIRKGGFGTPIVISVFMFIFYYIIDNMGYKMARDGHWPVWQGIWLSSAVLLPLGIFLTYKAVNDSAVFNPDAWVGFLRRVTGLHQTRKLAIKEVIINETETPEALSRLDALKASCQAFLDRYPGRQRYIDYWQQGYDKPTLRALAAQIDDTVDYLSNSRDQMVINKAMDFPIVRQLLTYHPTNYPKVGLAIAILFPIGLIGWAVGLRHQRNLKRDIAGAINTCNQLTAILKGEYDREMEYASH